jgi:hypothetical protein
MEIDINNKEKYHWEDENNGDVIIKIEDKKFYVYKSILVLWSKYFERMFSSNMKESQLKEIEIKEKNSKDFLLVLEKIYPPCKLQYNN